MITCPTCKGEFPSYPELTAHIGNPACANEIIASPEAKAFVCFVADCHTGGLWKAGEIAEDLGWESILPEDDPHFVPVRLLRLEDGQVLNITNPFERGIVVRVADDEAAQEAILGDIDSVLPLVKELTAYQALVYVALYRLNIPDAESAIKLVAKHAKLIEDHDRRRFEPSATARVIMEQEAQEIALGRVVRDFLTPGNEETARAIIKRISDAAIELAFVRHSLTSDEVDVHDDADVKVQVEAGERFCEEVKADTFNCLTGDDSGCLNPEELDETNCELLWLQKILSGAIPPSESEDAARLDWLEEFVQTGLIEAAFEMDGGVHLTLSKVGYPASAYREKNSLREAIDVAMKEDV